MPKFIDRTGIQYGMLTVLAHAGKKNRRHKWLCQCQCGTKKEINGEVLGKGTISCGCIRRCKARLRATQRNYKHGLSSHPLYYIHNNAYRRCNDIKNKQWMDYGGRGITFELGTLTEFVTRMMPTWSEGMLLDRVDNAQGYTYDNIRWVDRIQSNNNRRNVKPISHEGMTMTVTQWAKYWGIARSSAKRRLDKLGVTIHVKELH
jgi:hypothetical protein